MKLQLAPRTFRIYWDAHAWVGVVTALLLHLIFFMGAFALFQRELDAWANPARTGSAATTPAASVAPGSLGPLLAQLDR